MSVNVATTNISQTKYYEMCPGCEVLKFLSAGLDKKLNFIYPEDGGIGGVPLAKGNWNGIMGLLQKGKADFAINLAFSNERFKVVDFSIPYATSPICFAIRNKEMSKTFVFFYPFQIPIWITMFVSITLCCMILSILLYQKLKPKARSTFLLDKAISSFEVLTGSRAFSSICKSTRIQLFCAVFVLCMRILTFCFVAVFFSFLMAPIKRPPIKTFSELGLAAKLDQIKIYFNDHMFVGITMKNAKQGTLKYLAENKVRHGSGASGLETEELLMRDFVVIDVRSILESYAPLILGNQHLFISDDNLGNIYVGMVVRRGYKYAEKVKEIALRLIQSGIYEKLSRDVTFRQKLHSIKSKIHDSTEPKKISLSVLRGCFLMFGLGLSFASFACICEMCVGRNFYSRKRVKRQNGHSFFIGKRRPRLKNSKVSHSRFQVA